MPTILLAEDDTFLARAYQVKLQKSGYTVVLAKDGEEALAKLEKGKPDLILMDLIMPNKDGFETIAAIQSNPQLRGTPIIVASNLGQEEDIDRAMKLGAVDYIIKSEISIQALIDKVSEYLSV
jgi:CheY-like chemotaxis protein